MTSLLKKTTTMHKSQTESIDTHKKAGSTIASDSLLSVECRFPLNISAPTIAHIDIAYEHTRTLKMIEFIYCASSNLAATHKLHNNNTFTNTKHTSQHSKLEQNKRLVSYPYVLHIQELAGNTFFINYFTSIHQKLLKILRLVHFPPASKTMNCCSR